MSIETPRGEPGCMPAPTIAVADPVTPGDFVGLTPWRDSTTVLTAVRQLTASTEPAVVLTSLAAVCASVLVDECWGTILQEEVIRPISHPMPAAAEEHPTPATQTLPLADSDQFTLSFAQSAWADYPEFSGTMTWRWHDRDRPTGSDRVIAQLLLDRALELVRVQRLEAALAVERDKAANLQVALVSNREIGLAIGILMSTYKMTREQGFDLLRMASQHTHRKLREVAAGVCDTGMLELPAPKS